MSVDLSLSLFDLAPHEGDNGLKQAVSKSGHDLITTISGYNINRSTSNDNDSKYNFDLSKPEKLLFGNMVGVSIKDLVHILNRIFDVEQVNAVTKISKDEYNNIIPIVLGLHNLEGNEKNFLYTISRIEKPIAYKYLYPFHWFLSSEEERKEIKRKRNKLIKILNYAETITTIEDLRNKSIMAPFICDILEYYKEIYGKDGESNIHLYQLYMNYLLKHT